jgi:hypothetical protein
MLVNLVRGFSKTDPREMNFALEKPEDRRARPAAPPAPTVVASGPSSPASGSSQTLVGERRTTAKKGLKCAALPLKVAAPTGALDGILNELLLTELQQSGFEAIGLEDINAMLGFEKTKEAAGCDDSQCVVEIGHALGVDYLAAGNVAAIEGSFVLTLKLMDVRQSKVLARVNRTGDGGQKGLPAMLAAAVQDLVAQSKL